MKPVGPIRQGPRERPGATHNQRMAKPRRPRRLTRIVATLGPATERRGVLEGMVQAGLDVARLNMSHGTPEFHARMAARVRAAARAAERPLGVMVDLQGPKVRLGAFAAPLGVTPGDEITLTTRASDTDPAGHVLPVDYRHLPVETEAGQTLLLADGAVRLLVVKVAGQRVQCRVLEGREIPPRAGLALPEAKVVRSALTAKDRRDLDLAVKLGADFVALSFVRRAHDLQEARRQIARLGGDQALVAKIETRAALQCLDEVLGASDAVMVARGDLGVELPPERVPIEQKRIIEACNATGKPVITATQMLESMRHASRPTRAEASDVANAVLDGSWAVMLSAETATGDFPVESVAMLDRIAREAEPILLRSGRRRGGPRAIADVSEGIAEAGVLVAFEVGARALVALTRSGATACQVARFLPPIPAYGYTSSRRTLARMTLYRGITPRYLPEQPNLEAAIDRIEQDLKERRNLGRGDRIVVLGGSPRKPAGTTDRLIVHMAR